MIGDVIAAMQRAVKEHLKSDRLAGPVEFDGIVNAIVPWRPHVLQTSHRIGWQLHSVLPDSNAWEKRIARARLADTKLKIGIAATEDTLRSADFLLACQRLEARLLLLKERREGFSAEHSFGSVPDFVCERRIKLASETAQSMLDVALKRVIDAKTNVEKGVTLEVLVALMLSQVDNFEVADIGISNRTQQMDVLVHNRSVGGMLGNSPLVLAEAKNWRNKVTPTEHAAFLRKLASRNRRAKLGFLVATGGFTAGLALEARRDSKEEVIVVFVDGAALPSIWRGTETITRRVERLVIDASVGA